MSNRVFSWLSFSAIAVFFFAAILLQLLIPGWHLENRHLYSVIDGVGGVGAIVLSMVLLLIRPYRVRGDYLFVVACAFAVIGTIEIFGLATTDYHLSVWFDCFSVLLGALWLLALWLPYAYVPKLFGGRAILLSVGPAIAVCLFLFLSGKQTLPPAAVGNNFTFELKGLMVVTGLLYLASMPRIFSVVPAPEKRLITIMVLFLGLGGITFPVVHVWGPKWWLVQVAQFVPYLFVIGYIIRSFLDNQRRIFESEERFRTLFEEAPVGIGVIDMATDSFIQVNPTLSRLLGYSELELSKIDLKTLIHPDDQEAAADTRKKLLRGEISNYMTEKRLIAKGNRMIWVKAHGALLKVGSRILQEFRLIEDVTPEKIARERIQTLVSELVRTNAELERFTSVVSHDLKSPLNTISSYVQLIGKDLQGVEKPEIHQFMKFVVDACQRLKNLIDDLLTYARVSQTVHQFKPVDCSAICREVLGNLRAEIQASGARVIAGTLPEVYGDKVQLSQLFQNLIGNALKYCRDVPPEVRIWVEERKRDWIFAVADNGIGFSMDHAEEIFEEFQRLHDPQSYSGTGLGLSICKTIIKRHGGKIWAQSTPGQGSTFFFTLPKEGVVDIPIESQPLSIPSVG